jgi:hypothetical protein
LIATQQCALPRVQQQLEVDRIGHRAVASGVGVQMIAAVIRGIERLGLPRIGEYPHGMLFGRLANRQPS